MTKEVQEEQQLDRKDVKLLVYKQRVSDLEEQVNDLQVEVIFLSERLKELTPDTKVESEKEDEEVSGE